MNTQHQQQIMNQTIKRLMQQFQDQINSSNRIPPDLWLALGQQGYLGLLQTESTSRYQNQARLISALSRCHPSLGLSVLAHAQLATQPIMQFGSNTQKKTWLPRMAQGTCIGALALTEANAGSDIANIQLTAKKVPNGYQLDGKKIWITNAPEADVIIVYARTEAIKHGLTAFIVDAKTPGIHCSAPINKIGMQQSSTGELCFKQCIVPESAMLGDLNQGLKMLMHGLDYERVMLAAGPVGILHRCLDILLPYITQRYQFDTPLANHQLIQKKVADIYAWLQQAQNNLMHHARACDNRSITREDAASVLYLNAKYAVKAASETIQGLGANGYTPPYKAGELLLDAKLYEIGGGTMEMRALLIGREVIKQYEKAQANEVI